MVARGTNFDAPSETINYNLGYSQNMPQTSNSLLSPTKSMVAMATNGNQGQTVMHL